MRYLNGYKIFESRNDMDLMCRRYNITNHSIGSDGLLNVDSDVSINTNFTPNLNGKLPLRFGVVTGDFNCGSNRLTSLSGSPRKVGGDFSCGYNRLTSLSGGPEEVGGDFSCFENDITSLSGSPIRVGNTLVCENNKILSLEGIPESRHNYFVGNPIFYVAHAFVNETGKRSALIELFKDTDIIRGNEIIYDRLVWFFEEIGLELPDMNRIEEHYKIIR